MQASNSSGVSHLSLQTET